MTRVIAIMNQHQQVGKTTTTLNLGYALVLMNKRVMMIDLDPKAQLSRDCGFSDAESGASQLLASEQTLVQVSQPLADRFHIIPVGQQLSEHDQTTGNPLQQGRRLKQAIADDEQQPDFILIDCPARPGLLMLNGLLAADEIIVPTKANYSSIQGLVRIVQLFKKLKSLAGGAKLWLLLTEFKPTETISVELKTMLNAYFPERIFDTVIRRDEAIQQSRAHNKAIFDYHQNSEGAADYFALAQDIIQGRVS